MKLMDYVRHRYKQPEYFNFQKYAMLPQCYNTDQIADLEPQYVAYHEMIYKKAEQYEKLLAPAALAIEKSVMDKINAVKITKRSPYRPFGAFAQAVLQALRDEYDEKFKSLNAYRLNYYRERGEMSKEFKNKLLAIQKAFAERVKPECCGEGNTSCCVDEEEKCNVINALKNSYLPKFAEQTEAFQHKVLAFYKYFLNDLAYWVYPASINDDAFHVDFYHLAVEFMGRLDEINTTRFMDDDRLFYPCEFEKSGSVNADDLEIETADCYLTPKIEVDLGAFKLEISCETYKLEAGEGLVGKIEYARSSGDVTLAFGVGAAVPRVLFKSPGIESGLEVEAKSQVYITFDNFGTPVDLGVLWEAEMKVSIEMGSIKESIGLEEGLTAGFGSGVQIKENSQLKQAIDKTFPVQPDAAQINKNVPLYKK